MEETNGTGGSIFSGGLVFFSVLDFRSRTNKGWWFIDPHRPQDYTEFVQKISEARREKFLKYHVSGFAAYPFYPLHPLPDPLLELCYYESVFCDDKICFIGGRVRDDDIHRQNVPYANNSKAVFIYDILARSWVKRPQLNIARALPTVVAAGKILHVFGGLVNRQANPHYRLQQWGESLDLGSPSQKRWKYIPTPPYGDKLCPPFEDVSFHALYERQHRILLWFVRPIENERPPRADVYAYDYTCKQWVEPPSIDESGPLAIHPPVIVGDVLIWNYFEKIIGYDLIKQEQTFSLSIPDSPFHKPFCLLHRSHTTFLLPVGKSKLCLIWYEPSVPNRLYCYRFLMKTTSSSSSEAPLSSSDLPFVLEFDGYAHLPIRGTGIGHAVSSINGGGYWKNINDVAPPLTQTHHRRRHGRQRESQDKSLSTKRT